MPQKVQNDILTIYCLVFPNRRVFVYCISLATQEICFHFFKLSKSFPSHSLKVEYLMKSYLQHSEIIHILLSICIFIIKHSQLVKTFTVNVIQLHL